MSKTNDPIFDLAQELGMTRNDVDKVLSALIGVDKGTFITAVRWQHSVSMDLGIDMQFAVTHGYSQFNKVRGVLLEYAKRSDALIYGQLEGGT